MNLNVTYLIGRLTKDPQLYQVGTTNKVVCSLATNRPYKDNHGEWKEETVFHALEAWDTGAETFYANLKKGDLIFVEGSNKNDSWEDADGNKKYKSYIRVNKFGKVTICKNPKKETVEAGASEGQDIPFE